VEKVSLQSHDTVESAKRATSALNANGKPFFSPGEAPGTCDSDARVSLRSVRDTR